MLVLEDLTNTRLNYDKNHVKNFNLLESNTTTLAGNQAHRLLYTYTSNSKTIKAIEVFTIKDGNRYRVAYYADPAKYNTSTIQKMIDSFKLV
jgi:PsbP-like protein